jgi:hypothetical protein
LQELQENFVIFCAELVLLSRNVHQNALTHSQLKQRPLHHLGRLTYLALAFSLCPLERLASVTFLDYLSFFANSCLSDLPALRRVSRYMISSISRRLKLSSAVDSRTITPLYCFTKAVKSTAEYEHLPALRSPMLGPGPSAFVSRHVSARNDLSVAVETAFEIESRRCSSKLLVLLSHMDRDLQMQDENDGPASLENACVEELEKVVGLQAPNSSQKRPHHFFRLGQMREIPDFMLFLKSLELLSPKVMSASLLSVCELFLDNPGLAVGAQENETLSTIFACNCALLRVFERCNLIFQLASISAEAFASIFALLSAICSLPESKRFCDMLSY